MQMRNIPRSETARYWPEREKAPDEIDHCRRGVQSQCEREKIAKIWLFNQSAGRAD